MNNHDEFLKDLPEFLKAYPGINLLEPEYCMEYLQIKSLK